MNSPRISAIAVISENRALGDHNKLIWKIPEDLKHFRETTRGHPIIMGKKTFESIGRLLPDRVNIIVTRDKEYTKGGCLIAHSIDEAFELARGNEKDEVFIIGGGQIYAQALPKIDRLYLTLVHTIAKGDTFFPDYSEFTKVIDKRDSRDDNYSYTFLTLERV